MPSVTKSLPKLEVLNVSFRRFTLALQWPQKCHYIFLLKILKALWHQFAQKVRYFTCSCVELLVAYNLFIDKCFGLDPEGKKLRQAMNEVDNAALHNFVSCFSLMFILS